MAQRAATSRVSQETILEAAIQVLREHTLVSWTVDQVSAQAQCAKGLVLYHFKSKDELLRRVAERVRRAHVTSRVEALSGSGGTEALNRLWACLSGDVKSGGFGLWVSLVNEPVSRRAASRTAGDELTLAEAAARALEVPANSVALSLMGPVLDGGCLQLLQGREESLVRESFDAFWLGVLSDAD